MIVDTLNTNKSTLSSFAATLVGNKKIVVQKRASEIEKTNKRRESADPRSEQVKAITKKPFGVANRTGSMLDDNSTTSFDSYGIPGTIVANKVERKHSDSSMPFNAIVEGEEEEGEEE